MRTQVLMPFLAGLGLLFAAGCQSPWVMGGKTYVSPSGAYSLLIPAGWVFAELPPGQIVATKDGLLLEEVTVRSFDLKEPLPGSKRMLKSEMAPLELAEALLDQLRGDHSLLGLEVTENQPVEFGGRPGIRLTFRYHTDENLRVSRSIHAVLTADKLYVMTYTAATRYYFDQARPASDGIAASFRLGVK